LLLFSFLQCAKKERSNQKRKKHKLPTLEMRFDLLLYIARNKGIIFAVMGLEKYLVNPEKPNYLPRIGTLEAI